MCSRVSCLLPHNGVVHVDASAVRVRDCLVFHVRLKKKCSIRVVALCLVPNNIHCSIRVRVINQHLAEHEGGFIGNELVIQQLCVVEIVLSLSMFINLYVMMY